MKKLIFLSPVQKFIHAESFSGMLLFGATILALVLSNSPLQNYYNFLWEYEIGISSENFYLVKPLIFWINDGLMAIFFFLIGLEIKREVLLGELNTVKKASLPIAAAIGGMLFPLLFYILLNDNPETAHGWGISMATDIAFSLAILKLLGKRVPLSLKIFLTAFAIIDDIGAVMIIAIVYTSQLSWSMLVYAGILLLILYVLSYFKIYSKYLLFILGSAIWLLFLKSGIHPTIAGILLAFSVPIKQKISEYKYAEKLKEISKEFIKSDLVLNQPILSEKHLETVGNIQDWTSRVSSPLQNLEHRLHNWVAFLIMPVFALSNAGINLTNSTEIDMSLVITIAVSLFAGKTIGVSLFTYASVKLKLATLPKDINYKHIFATAILSGVGFTMSLFIGGLAFSDNIIYLNSAKVGIIAGSLSSGILGYLMLKMTLKK